MRVDMNLQNVGLYRVCRSVRLLPNSGLHTCAVFYVDLNIDGKFSRLAVTWLVAKFDRVVPSGTGTVQAV